MRQPKQPVGCPREKQYGQIKSIRFDERDQQPLRSLAELWRCSEAAAVRRAIAIAADQEQETGTLSREERAARVRAVFGSMPDLPSIDDYVESKRQEADHEEAKWERLRTASGP